MLIHHSAAGQQRRRWLLFVLCVLIVLALQAAARGQGRALEELPFRYLVAANGERVKVYNTGGCRGCAPSYGLPGRPVYSGSTRGRVCQPATMCPVPARPRPPETSPAPRVPVKPVPPVKPPPSPPPKAEPEDCPCRPDCDKRLLAAHERIKTLERQVALLKTRDCLTRAEWDELKTSLLAAVERRLKALDQPGGQGPPLPPALTRAEWLGFVERLRVLEQQPDWFGLQVTDPLTGTQSSPQRIELGSQWELYLPPGFTVHPGPAAGTE